VQNQDRDDAVVGIVSVLVLHPLAQCAEVVAEVEISGRLNA